MIDADVVGHAADDQQRQREPEVARDAKPMIVTPKIATDGEERRAGAAHRRAVRDDDAGDQRPAAGAARSTPRPCGPAPSMCAKIGSSATAPPKSTEKRSSVIAASRIGCSTRNGCRRAGSRRSASPRRARGRASCAIEPERDERERHQHRRRPRRRGGAGESVEQSARSPDRATAANCQVELRHATAFGVEIARHDLGATAPSNAGRMKLRAMPLRKMTR